MRTLGKRRRSPAIGALLAAVCASAVSCGGSSDAASAPPAEQHFRAVLFSVDPVSSYSAAVEQGALERAAALGVVLDVVRAGTGAAQVQQVRAAAGSGQYIGGLILPRADRELCDVSTNLAPDNNFMLAVADTPICGRAANEGDDTWAPGTLTFVSAGQEISSLKRWGEYIRAANPGRQQVVLLSAELHAEQFRIAATALRAIESDHPQFDIVQTLNNGGTAQEMSRRLLTLLRTNPGITVVASVRPEMTTAAAKVLAHQAKDRVGLYDFGGNAEVLRLIERGRVKMTVPQYPRTLGATAVQALYDARVGRTPITRYHAGSGRTARPGPPAEHLMVVTKENLEQFRAAGLSEY